MLKAGAGVYIQYSCLETKALGALSFPNKPSVLAAEFVNFIEKGVGFAGGIGLLVHGLLVRAYKAPRHIKKF